MDEKKLALLEEFYKLEKENNQIRFNQQTLQNRMNQNLARMERLNIELDVLMEMNKEVPDAGK